MIKEQNIRKLLFRKSGKRNNLEATKPLQAAKRIQNYLTILFLFFGNNIFAQDTNAFKRIVINEEEMKQVENITKLNAEELQLFKQTTEVKINEFQNCIIIIGDKSKPEFDRNKAITSAVQLFVPDAKMQTSILYPTGEVKISSYLIEKYLQRLKGLPYAKVEINFYNIAYLSEFKIGSENKYHGTATIFQEFKGITNEGAIYTERTVKTIDIILEYVEDEFFKVKRWTIKLGDIKVTETRKV